MIARTITWLVPAVVLLALGGATRTQTAPYTGLETRAIKALSDRDIADLVAGRGAGYALAAELNGHPGPLHVLELDARLGLTAAQRSRVQASFDAMNAEARSIGAEIVAAERGLDQAFAAARIDKAEVARRSEDLGHLYGRYRAAHLKAHLDMTALLSPRQIAAYESLRGYKGTEPTPGQHGGQH